MFQVSQRLQRLPPYLFAQLEKKKAEYQAKGKEIIDLSIGDPDLMPPACAMEKLASLLSTNGIHRYSSTRGTDEFRYAVSWWMKKRFDVDISPEKEVCLGIGSKEIIAHIPLAFTQPGDIVLIPEPGYPPYQSGTIFAMAEPYFMPLLEENNFLPDLDAIPEEVASRAKIIFVNYPNNPTTQTATLEFYQKLVDFARRWNIIIVSDLAYSEIYFNTPPVSVLQVDEAKDISIELHSLTKTFSMSGWRLAWACGSEKLIQTIAALKANLDSGQFMALQNTGAYLLRYASDEIEKIRQIYKKRRDIVVAGLEKIGWRFIPPQATFYVWIKIPNGMPSFEFVNFVLDTANVLLSPGAGFGRSAEGYVRLSLTADEEKLRQAIDNFNKIL